MTRILQFIACCFASSIACAQLTETTIVSTRIIAPPSGTDGWTDMGVDCPAGLIVLSGGISSDSQNVLVTSSAPSFVESSLYSQGDGVRSAGTGWYGNVRNLDGAPHPVVMTAVCGLMPNIVVSIASASVSAATDAGVGVGVGTLIATCPANYSAMGGGVDSHTPSRMTVSSSAPTFGTQYITGRPVGSGGAPSGWNGGVRNQGNAVGLMKVAAICTPTAGVTSVVSDSFFVGAGSAAGSSAVCPIGTVALSGGVDSPFYTTTAVVATTPQLSGAQPLPIDRPPGSYTSAVGWYGILYSYGPGLATARVAAVCAPLAQTYAIVYEFFNSTLKHYFRTANVAEAAAIDNGAAGVGWVRTGDNFYAYPGGVSTSPGSDVCRFYSPRSNSHFYTAFASECASLKAAGSGWNYEGLSFHIPTPTNNACGTGTKPVYRLYNNRAQFNDTNHRFTSDFENVAPLQRAGWTYEGVAFCALVL